MLANDRIDGNGNAGDSGGDGFGGAGDQPGPAQLAHSPGSEWIAHQLQNAYLGLAATLASATEPQPTLARTDLDSQDNQPDAQHAAGNAQEPGHTQSHEQQADAARSSHTDVPSNCDIDASQVSSQFECGDGHNPGHSDHTQQQRQPCSTAVAQPAAAAAAAGDDDEGTQTGHDSHQHHEVPHRVPAAVALESPADSRTAQHRDTESNPLGQGSAPSDAQTERDQPQVQQSRTPKQETKKKNSNPTPVFVPIVVAMDGPDHKLLVEEWYSRQMVSLHPVDSLAVVMAPCVILQGHAHKELGGPALAQHESSISQQVLQPSVLWQNNVGQTLDPAIMNVYQTVKDVLHVCLESYRACAPV